MEELELPQIISQPFAANGEKTTIPDAPTGNAHASVSEGFPRVTMLKQEDGGEAPYGQDFNGIFNLMSQFYFFVQNGGMYTFNEEVSAKIGGYPLGARLFYVDGNGAGTLLRSAKPNNTDNFITNPEVIGTSWLIETTSEKYVNDNFVSIATDQTITGYKAFSNFGVSPHTTSQDSTQLVAKCENLDINSTPSVNTYGGITLTDKNNIRLGKFEIAQYSNGNVISQLSVSRPVDGGLKYKSITARMDSSGYGWIENLRPNYGALIGLGMEVGKQTVMPNDGVLIIAATATGQSNPEIRIYDGSGHQIGVIGHHGGSSEYNRCTFTTIVTKGQTINCTKGGTGTAVINFSYLAPWR